MKKYLTLGNILLCGAAVLGLVSILMMFAPGVQYTVDAGLLGKSVTAYTGAQITFGYTEKTGTPLGEISAKVFNFSFMNLLTYILVLAGLVLAVLAIVFKCKYIAPVAAGCFLIAGIFYFLAVPFCAPAIENSDALATYKEALSLGAGAIVAGILSIISAVLCVLKTLVFKK